MIADSEVAVEAGVPGVVNVGGDQRGECFRAQCIDASQSWAGVESKQSTQSLQVLASQICAEATRMLPFQQHSKALFDGLHLSRPVSSIAAAISSKSSQPHSYMPSEWQLLSTRYSPRCILQQCDVQKSVEICNRRFDA